jgi:hypothetical protein
MKPTRAQIADLWCKWMHTAPMWPSHGRYECWTCGRHHRVCLEQAPPAGPRARFVVRARHAPAGSIVE